MSVKVSIIIPCYNHGGYIREALQSVTQYGCKSDYEIIIVNDGSTEQYTLVVLEELVKEGYRVIHQKNQGLGAARNTAIKVAIGNYILPLDCDNHIRPEYLSKGILLLDTHPEIGIVYGDAEYFGDREGIWHVGEFNLQRLMIENYIDACAMFRKSAWEAVGGYDEEMPVMGVEDWDLWLRFSFNGFSFWYEQAVLFDYRVLQGSMLRSIDSEKGGQLMRYLYDKHKKFLDPKFVQDHVIASLKRNKRELLKLTLDNYFPRTYEFTRRLFGKKR